MNIVKKGWICIFLFGISLFVYGSDTEHSGHISVKQDTLIFATRDVFALTGQNITIGFEQSDLKWHYDRLEVFDSTGREPNYLTEIKKHLWGGPTVIITGENITRLICGGGYSRLVNPDFTKCSSLKFLQICTNGTLDISKNIALEHLEFTNVCVLDSLDLSDNVNLRYLNIHSCRLNEIDVSKNTKLEYFDCNSNQLTSLDLSQNTSLKSVDCKSNCFTPLAIRDILYSLHGESPDEEKHIFIGSQYFCYVVNNRIGDIKDRTEITFDLERITRKGWIIF